MMMGAQNVNQLMYMDSAAEQYTLTKSGLRKSNYKHVYWVGNRWSAQINLVKGGEQYLGHFEKVSYQMLRSRFPLLLTNM